MKTTFLVVTILGLLFAVLGLINGPYGSFMGTMGAAYTSMLWTIVLMKFSARSEVQREDAQQPK